jgi:hypothetical protein
VINRDLIKQPALEFGQSHGRLPASVIAITLSGVGAGRARQEPQFSDHGTNQTLDMTATMGRPWRTNIGIDPIPQASAPERRRPVWLRLIGVQPQKLAIHRIVDLDAQMSELRLFRKQRA